MPAYGSETTTDELLAGRRLDGQTIVVTGGSGGLGEETARALAAAGARVAITARDAQRADAAIGRIVARHPAASLSWHQGDLLSLRSVGLLADDLRRTYPRVDVLIGNAGIMGGPLRRSEEGYEAQFATNHLAHFALASGLLPSLLAAPASRVVVVSSAGHGFGRIHWDDPHFLTDTYEGFDAYAQSKTANVLFAAELDRRFASQGLRAASVHPGGIHTDLGRSFSERDRAFVQAALGSRAEALEWKSVEQGAATQVWAAVVADPAVIGGNYLEDCGVAEINPDNTGTGPGVRPEALDPAAARRLWELSEGLTGHPFGATPG